jgi:predicted amidohydrolase
MPAMALDLLLRQARLTEGKEALADIAIADGRIVEIADRIVADAPAAAVRLLSSAMRRIRLVSGSISNSSR